MGRSLSTSCNRTFLLNRVVRSAFFLVAVYLFAASPLRAQPTESSLIQAWENLQRSDPQIVTFKKIEDGRYEFKTHRFPFDGELKILNAIIDDRLADVEPGIIRGAIEYDLVGLSKEVQEKYDQL
jgi:hypothetical protein